VGLGARVRIYRYRPVPAGPRPALRFRRIFQEIIEDRITLDNIETGKSTAKGSHGEARKVIVYISASADGLYPRPDAEQELIRGHSQLILILPKVNNALFTAPGYLKILQKLLT
jgi:hypothetical protein